MFLARILLFVSGFGRAGACHVAEQAKFFRNDCPLESGGERRRRGGGKRFSAASKRFADYGCRFTP